MYPDEAVWDDARTSWLQSGQELQLIEWLSDCLSLLLFVLLILVLIVVDGLSLDI